jgi:NAD(P)-dependent dehydrogenase (short-subunit alcohol dehydrogenase family)
MMHQQQQDAGRAPVAVVTGGSQGLGHAIARELAARGWWLVVDARRRDRLDAAVAELADRTRVVGVVGDVTDPAHRAEVLAAARELGGVDLVVHNASTLGASPLPAVGALELDVLRRTFEVNVVAPIALQQALDASLRPHAAVVAITSDAAVEAYPGWGGYGASKAALEHAFRVLAEERPDLRVLVIDPGDMRTEMHQDAFPGEDISDRPEPGPSAAAIVALVLGDAPSGRHRALAPEPEPDARREVA